MFVCFPFERRERRSFGALFFFFPPSFFLLPQKRKEDTKKTNLLRGALESVEPDVLGALRQGADADDRGAAGLFFVFVFLERERVEGRERRF